jgi:hypothetical protein
VFMVYKYMIIDMKCLMVIKVHSYMIILTQFNVCNLAA